MSIKELEEEIAEIEKVKERFKPDSLQWNNIENIITEKKRELSRLKDPESCEEDHVPGHCTGDCSSCGR
jgi:tRNA U34 5-carboxymethylaminomethyl modifying enzyme MnmG/GidA